MTLQFAIDACDAQFHNTCTYGQKAEWLSALDGRVQAFLDTCSGVHTPFAPYSGDTPGATELLVGAPYEEMYLSYLEGKIHYHNAEIGRFNNANAMFQSIFARWQDAVVRGTSAGQKMFV